MTASPHWAVCRTFSFRAHWVRPEIEKTNHGTFLPTYARVWVRDGKFCAKERALMPGYLFFMTEPDRWGEVKNVEGVFEVVRNAGSIRVSDAEMQRMVLGHVFGAHNDVNLDGLERQKVERQRARRPRASRRARAAA